MPPTPGEYSGQGLDDAPKSPLKGHKKVSSRGSRGSLRSPPKEIKKKENEDTVVYEKLQNWNGGGHLTSVKPTADYEDALRLDEVERTRAPSGELVLKSGRIPSAGWEQSGIRFAPLNVPLKRRLQTAVVLGHTLSAFIFLSNFFFLAAIPLTWPLLFPYIIYILLSQSSTNGRLSERSEWFRRQKFWSLFASYFPARLHRTEELPPTRKYLFGYHPHGIISHGAFTAFATEALGFNQLFPGITNSLLTLDSNFRVPFYRDYLLRLGLCSVSKESCTNILTKGGPNNEGMGRAITIVVGGARESLEMKPGTLRLVLNCRKGFVKLAVETGADLVPVLSFGENDIYDQLDPSEHPTLHKFQLFFKKVFGFTTPVFHARGVFNYDVGIMPYRRPMNIVVGRAIKVEQQSTPDFDYVNKIHAQYVKELQLIWDTWKDDFARERTAELEIVE
ncbi:DAGAT-domain-containing protein [Microthyrium microscopicum]|uniref:Diacylglycerol O-acyltransferase n=1 Tax=Microthyrium microscopicum TaxID=703497 RepID=A0A6A6U1B7_9PEZI|nr:DAGAT-domain-containing protein [Microthyrium microscopicum]